MVSATWTTRPEMGVGIVPQRKNWAAIMKGKKMDDGRPTHTHPHTWTLISEDHCFFGSFPKPFTKSQVAHNNSHESVCLRRFWVELRNQASQLSGRSSCYTHQERSLKFLRSLEVIPQDQIIFQRSKERSIGGLTYWFIVKYSQNIFPMPGSGSGEVYQSG